MLFAALRVKPVTRIPFCFLRQYRRYSPPTVLDMANVEVHKTAHPFDKTRLEDLLNRRFFYAPAFEIYGGT